MRGKSKTVYDLVSAPPTQADRTRLAAIRSVRSLPAAGVTSSTDEMLAALDRIVSTGDGQKFEVDKLTEWMETFPLASEAAAVAAWRGWGAGVVRSIADSVMLGGESPAQVAIAYHTTPETVNDIVKAARAEIRRDSSDRQTWYVKRTIWRECEFGARVSTCYHTPRCHKLLLAQRLGEYPFGREVTGWTRVRGEIQAGKEAAAWRAEGWATETMLTSQSVRDMVRIWESGATGSPGESRR